MGTATEEFQKRLASEWVPSFCEARRARNYFPEGFRWETAARVSEFDARWFLAAVDAGLVTETNGFFEAPMSRAKEQLFWSGAKSEARRSFTLWLEPIITIGTLARLNNQFGWPRERMGCQSEGWSVDLVCYSQQGHAVIGCEIKKSARQVEALLEVMRLYAANPSLTDPTNKGRRRNAWKKVDFIRRVWPPLFWAVGPEGTGQAFRVVRDGQSGKFDFIPAPERVLHFGGDGFARDS